MDAIVGTHVFQHLFLITLLLLTNALSAQPSLSYIPSASISRNFSGAFNGTILLSDSSAQTYQCGLICFDSKCKTFLFSITIRTDPTDRLRSPEADVTPLWAANRGRPVGARAALELTREGNLVLRDEDNTIAWSTNTSGKSVVRLNLTEYGNMILVGESNAILWQSYDHPTNTLFLGRKLVRGQRLVADGTGDRNYTEGQYYLSILYDGLKAFVGSSPVPQIYYQYTTEQCAYVEFTNGSLDFYNIYHEKTRGYVLDRCPSPYQYLRLDSDGHFRVYGWQPYSWMVIVDVFLHYGELGNCDYPLVCGAYGICSGERDCSCPHDSNNTEVTYFKQSEDMKPTSGCSVVDALTCQSAQNYMMLTLNDVGYFNSVDEETAVKSLKTGESCRDACARNCSCKAAFFMYGKLSHAERRCFMPSPVLSLTKFPNGTTESTAYVKVVAAQPQTSPPALPTPLSMPTRGKSTPTPVMVGYILASLFGSILITGLVILWWWRRRRMALRAEDEEVEQFCQVPGMPARFSHEELSTATNNFAHILGQGGFGSVFEGMLADGTTKVAVKRLDFIQHGMAEFLAEVRIISNIRHLNLVKLVGFCVEKSHRLLVYEFMTNGSLDNWIFRRKDLDDRHELDWTTRGKIINQVARGLVYLHDECTEKIVHLDIKPQNILLDENFDAKISDFGLSKLIGRDQSCVMTRMRGTPGYMAPEWLTSMITEKVDVYSFGIVLLEIMCCRRNLDHSKVEQGAHLLSLLKEKAEENHLADIVEQCGPEVRLNNCQEAVNMLKLVIWCLQSDLNKRPSMSGVVKALQGTVMSVDYFNLDYNFTNPVYNQQFKSEESDSTPPVPLLVLSNLR